MIYLTVPLKHITRINDYIRENIDRGAGDSFVENKEGFGCISIPDDNKDYAKKLEKYIDVDLAKSVSKDIVKERTDVNVKKLKDKASAGVAGK